MNKRIKTGSKSPLLPAVVSEKPVTKKKAKITSITVVPLERSSVNVGLRLVPTTSSADGKSFTLYVSTGKSTLQIPLSPEQMGTLLTNDQVTVEAEVMRPRLK